jgi:amino acid adenylation domain-containing protein/non-ribosomal peptide synthase protein (TIGR01720 family)
MIFRGRTLVELFVHRMHDDEGITYIKGSHKDNTLSYSEIFKEACNTLYVLQQTGIRAGDELVLQVEDPERFVVCFWAAILGGIRAVPVAVGRNAGQRMKLFNIWKQLHNPWLITTQDDFKHLQEISVSVTGLLPADLTARLILTDDLQRETGEPVIYNAHENDIAYIQFSSGSTSTPKGIQLTHKNIYTNCSAILDGIKSPACGDLFLSWMPLTHDMGLIGYHLTPVLAGWQHYIMPTELFIRKPVMWLQKISEYKITFTASPNFGYKYVLSYPGHADPGNIDLSHVRIITNGAEPISAALCAEFVKKMAVYGLKNNVIFPVYGLAEASLAVTFTEPGAPIKSIRLDRTQLGIGHTIAENTKGIDCVNVGTALKNNCDVRVVIKESTPAGDSVIGSIQVKGNNITAGYYNNREETGKVMTPDGWLDTGDIGFMRNGELFITGRTKDIFFLNGQNIYPHDVEQVAEQVKGISAGKIATGGRFNNDTQKWEMLAFVVHKGRLENFLPVLIELKATVNNVFQFTFEKVIPVRLIPKTTSGKIQRYKLIEQYEAGEFKEMEQQLEELVTANHTAHDTVLPEGHLEEQLCILWRKVLKNERIGATDNFFEVGGNSLSGMLLLENIHKQLHIKIGFSQLAKYQSPGELARCITREPPSVYNEIEKQATAHSYPLSAAQKGIYFFWATNGASVAYNIPVALLVKGTLDGDLLEQALNKMVNRHEILRTTFAYIDDEPKQMVAAASPMHVPVCRVAEVELQEELVRKVKPFDLHHGPLFRIELLEISKDRSILFADFHHIIFDGISCEQFFTELFELYGGQHLQPVTVQYKDYVYWEKLQSDNGAWAAAEKFWLNTYAQPLPFIELEGVAPRPQIFSYEGKKMCLPPDMEFSLHVRELAKRMKVTPYTVLLSAFAVFLSRYNNAEDFVIGVPASLRVHHDLRFTPGMFVNNLAVKQYINHDWTFEEFLHKESDILLKSLDNRYYPFDSLIQRLKLKRDMGRSPLFNTMLVYHNSTPDIFEGIGFSAERYFFDPGIAKYDLTLEIFDNGTQLECYIEYATPVFSEQLVKIIFTCFKNIVKHVAADAGIKIAEIPLLPALDEKSLIPESFTPATSFTSAPLVYHLIEKQLKLTPDAVAVIDGERVLTYNELDCYAGRVASQLHAKGIGPEMPVALMLERSKELIVSILGVFKAGGCYVPIDPSLPAERIKQLLTHSAAQVLIVSGKYRDKVTSWQQHGAPKHILFLDSMDDLPADCLIMPPQVEPSHLAYVIYTSGTTGSPKGVMVEHKALYNYIRWAASFYLKEEKPCFPLFTSVSFDLTVTSIFVPLVTGGQIITFPDDDKDLVINNVIKDDRINIMKLTPSHLRMVKEVVRAVKGRYVTGLKKIIAGGEQLSSGLCREITDLLGDHIEIFNEYGPTEATVGCMIHKYEKQPDNQWMAVPIGKPIDHFHISILDRKLQPVPAGAKGEIYIAGEGLARGYLFNEKLTAEKFVERRGEKLYKTGDVGIMDPNGIFHFRGRIDEQVKLNGYRIEPGEIEVCLLRHDAVTGATVVKHNDHNGAFLCAYYCCNPEEEITPAGLTAFLTRWLPAYMIPAIYVRVEQIPLTPNGKVDKRALPAPERNVVSAIKTAPVSEIERSLTAVWEDVLVIAPLGINDNFFELGGDSIKAVQISSRLLAMRIALSAKDILVCQTIENICLAGKAVYTDANSYEQGLVSGSSALAPAEHWFFEQQLDNRNEYLQSVLLTIKKPLDISVLEQSIAAVIKHHDGLRLNYNEEQRLLFFNNDLLHGLVQVPVFDLSSFPPERQHTQIIDICDRIRNEINIVQGLLIKPAVFLCGESGQLLWLAAHHLVIDGYSWRILLNDLRTVYMALLKKQPFRLPAKTASLKDWSAHLQHYAAGEALNSQRLYWVEVRNRLLAYNRFMQKVPSGMLHTVRFQLPKEDTMLLVQPLHKVFKVDTETALLTALINVVQRLTAKDECIIELEHHGRSLPGIDVSRTVGWFTAIFPVRFSLHLQEPPDKQLLCVQQQLQVPDSGIGYGALVYLAGIFKETAPLADIRFNYLGNFSADLDNELFSFNDMYTGEDIAARNATCNLEINCIIISGMMRVEIKYDTNIYTSADIEGLQTHFLQRLSRITTAIAKETDRLAFDQDLDMAGLSHNDLNVLFD